MLFAVAQMLLLTWNASSPVPVTTFILDMKNVRGAFWVEEYRGRNSSYAITGLIAGDTYELRYIAEVCCAMCSLV